MKKFANLYLAFVFIILYLPIFYLISYAFNAGDDMNSFTGFSLSHFKTMFGDGRLMLILTQTFFLAFLSAKTQVASYCSRQRPLALWSTQQTLWMRVCSSEANQ